MSAATTPGIIEEVRSFQRTARRLVRDPRLSVIQACVALVRLAAEARQKAELPELALGAIWGEAGSFVQTGERPMDREAILEAMATTDPVDLALRRLLRDGYAECPTCLRHLPDERAIDYQQQLARRSLMEALFHEEAV